MDEWLKSHAWKACIGLINLSRVRIPLSPQNQNFYLKQNIKNH